MPNRSALIITGMASDALKLILIIYFQNFPGGYTPDPPPTASRSHSAVSKPPTGSSAPPPQHTTPAITHLEIPGLRSSCTGLERGSRLTKRLFIEIRNGYTRKTVYRRMVDSNLQGLAAHGVIYVLRNMLPLPFMRYVTRCPYPLVTPP